MAKKKKVEKPPRIMTRRQQSLHQRQQRRQRIIFISGISVIAAIVVIIIVGWFIGEYRPMHTTIIKVGDTEFDTGYVIDYTESVLLDSPDENIEVLVNKVVNTIGENEIVRKAAEAVDIVVPDEDSRRLLEDNNTRRQIARHRTPFVETQLTAFKAKFGMLDYQAVRRSMEHLIAQAEPGVWKEEALWAGGEIPLELLDGPASTAISSWKHYRLLKEQRESAPGPDCYQRLIDEFPGSPLRPYAQWRVLLRRDRSAGTHRR